MTRSAAALAIVGLALTACDSTGPEKGANIRLEFSTSPSSATASMVMSSGAADLAITGSNGTLTLSDIHFIVDQVELERQEGSCDAATSPSASRADGDDDHEGDDECEEFEAGPFFVGLTLGSEVSVVTQDVPAGTYTKLKFEVEDTEFGEDDDDHHGSSVQDLMADIVAAGFPDWPRKASMVVSGTFTPADGVPVPFTTYFEAELNIRQRFDPPLVVSDQATTVTVEVDPSLWFRNPDGRVMDLSAFDYATTNQVVEFEERMHDGFHRVEHDHD